MMFLSKSLSARRLLLFSLSSRKLHNSVRTKRRFIESCSLCQNNVQFTRNINMGSSSSKSMKVSNKSEMNSPCKTEYVEGVVCNESDIKENEMKAFDLCDAGKVLIIKQNGRISALGAKCTHYGAPLVNGALGDGRLRCQWHGACFNIATGDIEDFPGLDSLPCFQVEIRKDGGVNVKAKKDELKSSHRIKPMVSRNRGDVTTVAIVGGGPSGAVCAETLRQEGYKGRIVLICKESALPYDRIKLSKTMDLKIDKIQLRSEAFYKEHDIEVLTGTEVVSVDSSSKVLKLSTGCDLKYTNVYICTGGIPRKPSIPGAELKNIFVLRTIEDANGIAEQITPETNVIVLGSSFIGMEAAAYAVSKAKSVTVIGKDDVPFFPVLGQEVGARLMDVFKEKGVILRMNSGIDSFIASTSEADKVGEVKLTDGSTLPADIVILGIGVTPATKFLDQADIKLHQSGAVIVDNHLESNVKGVFAGGDVAFAPVLGTEANIGHWQLAQYHGHLAALNILGKGSEVKTVPFFWTMLFGMGVRYAGFAPKFTEVIIGGNLQDLKFIAHYIKDDQVAAIATMSYDPAAAKFAELLSTGKNICKSDLQPDPLAWLG